MEYNDLDSFTVGLIKRTQERNKFLAAMNVTSDQVDNENEKPKSDAPTFSPLPKKTESEDEANIGIFRAEPAAIIDVKMKPQTSLYSLTAERKRINQGKFEFMDGEKSPDKPSKLEKLLSSPITEKRKRLTERTIEHIKDSANIQYKATVNSTINEDRYKKMSEKVSSPVNKIVSPVKKNFISAVPSPVAGLVTKERENLEVKKTTPINKSNFNRSRSNFKVDDSSDPCLLPLAARRALFEQKMTGRSTSKNDEAEEALHCQPDIKTNCAKDQVLQDQNYGRSVSNPKNVQDIVPDEMQIDKVSSNPYVFSSNFSLKDVAHSGEKLPSKNFDSHEEKLHVDFHYDEELPEKNVPLHQDGKLLEQNVDPESENDDDNNSLTSVNSSIISNSSDIVGQSTKLYPDLPPLNDLVHESFVSEEKSSTHKELDFISPIKSCSSKPIQSPKKPEKVTFERPIDPPSKSTTPLRTLSMYRREQKVRTVSNKPEEEDEIISDFESEARKRDLLKRYIESKSKKIDELKIEADKYNKIIYQSFRALDLCVQTNNVSERIEAEKILLVNVAKKNACVDELYRLQQEESIDLEDDPVGKITFNKLTLLVKGDFFVSQANGYDFYDYHFICLFTCGDKVVVTDALSSNHAIQEASLNFTNKTVFDGLRRNFKIRLDVYALALPKGKQRNDKKLGTMSLRLTPKSKSKVKYTHSPALKASPNNEKIKCNFKRIGYVYFTIDNIMRSRFELSNFMYTSPLEDQIMIESKIGCHCDVKFSSYINFHEKSGDYPVWNRRWCSLDGPLLYYWRFSEDEGDKQPLGVICLKQCVNPTIARATTDICMRPNSFSFLTLEKKDHLMIPVKHLMAADIRKERDVWLENLNKVLQMVRLWEQDALQPMDQAALDRAMK